MRRGSGVESTTERRQDPRELGANRNVVAEGERLFALIVSWKVHHAFRMQLGDEVAGGLQQLECVDQQRARVGPRGSVLELNEVDPLFRQHLAESAQHRYLVSLGVDLE